MLDRSVFLELLQTYNGISALMKEYDGQEILTQVCGLFNLSEEAVLNFPMGGYSKGRTNGAYQYVLQDLKKNIYHYDWLYGKLEDDTSRAVFTKLLQFRVVPDMEFVRQACDLEHHQYFDKTIVSCDENEVFVDCGGYIGDTAEDYIAQYQDYKKIYVYEPAAENILRCRENLKKYPNIEVRNYGVGEKNMIMSMSSSGSSSSFVSAGQNADADLIGVISLDEDIQEPVTYIKMDIEGFEIPALIGAKNHIQKDFPKLAVCLYHIVSDIWEIPRLIDNIKQGYRFYIRHYQEDQNWETVLYAIPYHESRKERNSSALKRVVAMAPYEHGWRNVELIKDCGLIPYLLYKNHGCDVTMVGAGGMEYPYLDKYLKGLKMEFLQNGSSQEKTKYISEHAKEIDCLILRGCYGMDFEAAFQYKALNSEGCIYVGLDANSHWMDRILWTEPDFSRFMDCCDVIATSCRAMQQHLNQKWPWCIEYFPNGYYGLDREPSVPEYDKKEKVILSVGRLGTEQKATNVLMEAFAIVAESLPDWSLRLVGSVETGFNQFIKDYFERHPELKERIVFVGELSDRYALTDEYRKARIFALASVWEGAPNVISEALMAGCATAVTRYDAYEEATGYGSCGMDSDIGDIEGFAEILLCLCRSERLSDLCNNAYLNGKQNFDMNKLVARLNAMIFK